MFTDGLCDPFRYIARKSDAKAVKMLVKTACPGDCSKQNTNYPLQFDKPHEAATMKQ